MKLLVVMAASLLAACSSKREPAPPPASGSGTVAPTVGSASSPPADAPVETTREHMRRHFSAVSDLQRAIAHGQLARAQQDAQWLIDHDELAVAEWRPFLDDVRTAAREVVAAPDLPTAAVLAARLGHACSRCHQELAATISFEWSEPPPDVDGLAAQMRRHQWAAARLWEGLVGPSDEMWRQGASTLATTKIDVGLAAGGIVRGDVAALVGQVRELSTRAAAELDPAARALLYGELLSTCAGCHALVRPTAVPVP